jgi:hypothetical protein
MFLFKVVKENKMREKVVTYNRTATLRRLRPPAASGTSVTRRARSFLPHLKQDRASFVGPSASHSQL